MNIYMDKKSDGPLRNVAMDMEELMIGLLVHAPQESL